MVKHIHNLSDSFLLILFLNEIELICSHASIAIVSTKLNVLYIDLRPGRAAKVGNAPV